MRIRDVEEEEEKRYSSGRSVKREVSDSDVDPDKPPMSHDNSDDCCSMLKSTFDATA